MQWAQFAVATLWPQIVMNQEHVFPSNCVFNAFHQAAIKACDPQDGVTNGIIDRPEKCDYDPHALDDLFQGVGAAWRALDSGGGCPRSALLTQTMSRRLSWTLTWIPSQRHFTCEPMIC